MKIKRKAEIKLKGIIWSVEPLEENQNLGFTKKVIFDF